MVSPPILNFLGFSCVRLLSGVFAGPILLFSSYMNFFGRPSRFFSRVAFLVLIRCGGLAWGFPFFFGEGSWSFCLRSFVLRTVDSSLGSGKVRSPVFVWAVRFCASFFSFFPLHVVQTELWNLFFLNKALVVRRLSSSCDLLLVAAAPCLFHV